MTLKTKMLLYALLCTLFMACSKDDDDNGGPVTFHVTISDVEAYTATATITHNGSNRDYYCAFVTEGRATNVQKAIDIYIGTLTDELTRYHALRNQRKKIVRVTGLTPQHTYTYIVFGLTGDGKQYGVPTAVSFTTANGTWEVIEDPKWQVTYDGIHLHQYNYYTCVHVEANDTATEKYIVAEYDVETVSSDASILTMAVEDYRNRLRNISAEATWEEDLLPRNGSSDHYAHLEPGQTYIAYAIGITEEGNPTGHYAKSKPFTFDEYPMLDDYEALVKRGILTTWLLDSDDGMTSLTATIKEDMRNESVLMRWKEFSSLYNFSVSYTAKDASLTIKKQLIRESTYIKIDGKNVHGRLYLTGWYINQQGDTIISTRNDITRGELQTDDSYHFTPLLPETQSGVALILEQNDYQQVIVPGAVLNLPFTMRKK